MANDLIESIAERYMQRCLQLAASGAGNVAPNPMVGAVLVYNNRIIGEGYHQKYGEAHAEVNCLASVCADDKPFISQSVLYVSLEPCAHYGKTPPCADLIIRHRIPTVIIGCSDPFIQVDGKGIEKLRAAGINVQVGMLEKEATDINKRFFTFHTKHRPYIILKWAQTADLKISSVTGKRLLISNEYSNRLVHKWRSEEASILAGTNTVAIDDPQLTTRLWSGRSPVRLVIDRHLRLPASLNIFNNEVRTIIFNTQKQEEHDTLLYYKVSGDKNIVQQVIDALYRLKIQSVLVEGGARLLQSFIDEKLWDEARIITNTKMITGQGVSAPELTNAILCGSSYMQDDRIQFFTPAYH